MKAVPSGGDKPDGPKPNLAITETVKFEEDQFFELLAAGFRQIEGRMMSLLEATLPDPQQCEGAKAIARQLIWEDHEWIRNHLMAANRS